MDTSKSAREILKGLLSLVRGPLFLAVLSLVLLIAAVPAQATFLRGYLQQDQDASPLSGAVADDSFPVSFEGAWRCVTMVTESAVASVPAGMKIISEVGFSKSSDGRVVARWNQPGWTETQSSITPLSPAEATMDRTNYYTADGLNGGWAARSRDRLKQVTEDEIVSTSCVDQYIDGQYLGRYKTQSILYRLDATQNVALLNHQ